MTTRLSTAVLEFAAIVQPLSDAQLDRHWAWEGYDEGLRFALFRVYETLSTLSARLNRPQTVAARILGQVHATYRDLQAISLGLDDETAARRPSEADWSARIALAHLTEAVQGFLTINSLGLGRRRAGEVEPAGVTDAEWQALWADDPFPALAEDGPFSALMAYLGGLHERVLDAFADVSEAELQTPIHFWEGRRFPLEFRLHRFHSHMRQHTIQIEKILAALDAGPNEVHRLLRHIYRELAMAEAARIGAPAGYGVDQCLTAAREIEALTEAVRNVLAEV
jgi:hypothetical protein